MAGGRPRKGNAKSVDDDTSKRSIVPKIDLDEINRELEKDNALAASIGFEQDVVVEEEKGNIEPSADIPLGGMPVTDEQKFEAPETVDVDDDIPEPDVNYISDDIQTPLTPPVKQRGYASGETTQPPIGGQQAGQPFVEDIIPEPIYKTSQGDDEYPDDKKTTGGGNKGNGGTKKTTGGGATGNPTPPPEPPRPDVNPKMDDLSPKQKREGAEKMADALLLSYQKFLPKPFKHFAKFNMRKLKQMEMDDKIELDMPVTEDGTTIQNYCDGVNNEVDRVFVVTDEMKEELREPLVEVLLEKGLALTPLQRLGLGIANHAVQMGINTIQILNSNNVALKTFERFHNEKKEANLNDLKKAAEIIKEQEEINKEKERVRQTQQETKRESTSETHSAPQKEETVKPSIDDVLFEEVKQKEANLDDYIATVENGGITVETEENKG